MDREHFDDLTRSVASEGISRRAVVSLLAASALGVAARLGLAEVVDATRTRRADRYPHSVPQAEGKRRKKHAKNHNQKHTTRRKGVEDIPLCRLDCEATGGKCCPDGSCVLYGLCCPGMKRCGVTSCIPENQCCPGDDSPGCQPCEVEVCVNGEWVCQPTEECGPPYGDSVLASS